MKIKFSENWINVKLIKSRKCFFFLIECCFAFKNGRLEFFTRNWWYSSSLLHENILEKCEMKSPLADLHNFSWAEETSNFRSQFVKNIILELEGSFSLENLIQKAYIHTIRSLKICEQNLFAIFLWKRWPVARIFVWSLALWDMTHHAQTDHKYFRPIRERSKVCHKHRLDGS